MSTYVIIRKDKLFFHFGILLKSKKILHYASQTNNMFAKDQAVRKDDFMIFSNGRKTKLMYKIEGPDEEIIIERAKNYYGKNLKYSIASNNCITFIQWCISERKEFNIFDIIKFYKLVLKEQRRLCPILGKEVIEGVKV